MHLNEVGPVGRDAIAGVLHDVDDPKLVLASRDTWCIKLWIRPRVTLIYSRRSSDVGGI